MKDVLKNFIPPIFLILMRKIFIKSQSNWYGDYESWSSAVNKSTGYDADLILEKVRSSLIKVKTGEAVYERDSVIFDEIQYSWPLLSSLLLAASRDSGDLSVLDFGGSLGSSYFQNKKILDCIKSVKWGVVEQKHFVSAGKDDFEDECLKFFESINECVVAIKPRVLLLSSVVQYLESPYQVLGELLENDFDIVIVDRTPFSFSDRDIIKLQVVPPTIYKASYPCRFFSRSKFNEFFKSAGFIELESFSALDGKTDECEFFGMIFKRK